MLVLLNQRRRPAARPRSDLSRECSLSSPIPPSKQDVDLAALNARYVSGESQPPGLRGASRGGFYGSRRAGSSKRSPPSIPRPLTNRGFPLRRALGDPTFTTPRRDARCTSTCRNTEPSGRRSPAVTPVPRGPSNDFRGVQAAPRSQPVPQWCRLALSPPLSCPLFFPRCGCPPSRPHKTKNAARSRKLAGFVMI